MKKFLSIFVALAMVLSLFAGVGARTAKAAAAVTLTATASAATLTGGAAIVTAIPGVATVTAVTTAAPTTAVVTIGTAAVGTFTGAGAVSVTTPTAATLATTTDIGFTATAGGNATVVVSSTANVFAGDIIKTDGSTNVGKFTVANIVNSTSMNVLINTAAGGTITKIVLDATTPTLTATTASVGFKAVAGSTLQTVAFTSPTGNLHVGDVVTVTMANTAAVAASGTVTIGGTVTADQIVTVTVNGTAYNYTVLTASTPGTVAAALATLIDAGATYGATALGTVITITADTAGVAGNAITLTATPATATPATTTTTTTTTTTSTLGLTTTGTFVGGVDGSGALGVNGVGTVMSGSNPSYIVNVTTAAAGTYDNNPVTGALTTAYRQTGATADITGAYNWAYTGIQNIVLNTLPTTIPITAGMKIAIDASGTMGVGRVLAVNGTTLVVNVTTAAVGIIGPNVYQANSYNAFDADWMTVGTAQPITIAAALTAGDKLVVHMVQAVPATSATAFVMVTGVPVVGDVATLTWQDTTAASHSVSWTVVAGDLVGVPANNVAMDLANLINSLELTTGNVSVLTLPTGSVIQLTQDVGGVAGNGKTLTGTTTAAVVPTLTISTLGGLTQPAYVEQGKTLQLVAKDATGAVVSVTWTSSAIVNATVSTTGLVTAASVASNLTGVTVITATSGTATGVFAVVVIPVQVITSLTINLVPAVPVSTTSQQFGAIASNATYSALDYTTQAVWTDALPVASIAATTGLLTYSTDEIGNVYASAGGITATANVKIATGVVTLAPVVGPVTKVIVLSIGSDIVTVDSKATTVDAAPEIVDGRTFVPIRFIAETFGSTVTWLPETKGVTIVLGDTTIGLQIGNATAVINGTIIALESAPYIKNSRTMVPLRVISESFGGNVAWDPINHIITITYVLPVAPAVPAA